MKANKFFLGLALVGAILTACNKEPEQVTGPTGDAYVSVKISMALIVLITSIEILAHTTSYPGSSYSA